MGIDVVLHGVEWGAVSEECEGTRENWTAVAYFRGKAF